MGLADPAIAGTTGKVAGRAVDQNDQPLYGATIVIKGMPLGAISDPEGRYQILGVPPGTYEVAASFVGYQNVLITGVLVSADTTTNLDVKLSVSVVAMEEIVVTAGRPIVDVHLTSSRSTLSREEIESLPVQELQDIVNLQAGVVDGHFRGGRIGEVQYQVDGVTTNNVHDNKSSLKLDRSVLQEVQVITGTFDAEYGQAMSGVVNAVLRDGSDQLRVEAEAYAGDYLFTGKERRIVDDSFRPLALENAQVTVSGPTPVKKTTFLLNVQRLTKEDHVRATRFVMPTDLANADSMFRPTGDQKKIPLGWSREWSGVAKLSTVPLPGLKLSYQAIMNRIKERRVRWAYRINPEGAPFQRTFSLTHGVDLDYALGERTLLDLGFRRMHFDYTEHVYEDAFDPRYDAAGPPEYLAEPGADDFTIGGVDLTHYLQETDSWTLKGAFTSQVTRTHHVKTGLEIQLPEVKFGTDAHLVGVGAGFERFINFLPKYPAPRAYKPVLASAYAQDQLEWSDLTLRAGLRLDLFDARSSVPGDPANPANSIDGAPVTPRKETSTRAALAPRLGVAYPITRSAGFHFAYGHFYQLPGLSEIFTNANYSILSELQAGDESSFGVFGNPDIKPEKTVHYEFGFKMAVSEDIGFDVSLFYKDIRDLLGVEFLSTYNDAEYTRLTNADFGNVTGFTVTFDQRNLGPLSTALDYTLQRVQGNASDPRETATRADNNEDPRPRLIPLNWDQRHTLNLTAALSRPRDYAVSAVLRVGSGQPYTPEIEAGHGFGLAVNSGRKPAYAIVDLRAEKKMDRIRPGLSGFLRVFNALDARYQNGAVFPDTGSPYYSRDPVGDANALRDPTRFYPPRLVELGFAYRWESQRR